MQGALLPLVELKQVAKTYPSRRKGSKPVEALKPTTETFHRGEIVTGLDARQSRKPDGLQGHGRVTARARSRASCAMRAVVSRSVMSSGTASARRPSTVLESIGKNATTQVHNSSAAVVLST